MTRTCLWMLVAPLASLAFFSGCGPANQGGGGGGAPAAEGEFGTTAGGAEYKIYPLKKLPEATQALPPLDGGRIEVTHPIGWKNMARSRDYLFAISKTNGGDPPRIVMTVKELPDQQIHTVTLENFDEFLALVNQEVEGELKEGEKLIEPVKALVLGERPFARYVRRIGFKIRDKTLSGERQVLRTLINDRLFTIELQTMQDKIHETRNDAYSLAANLKVKDGPGGAAPAPMPEEKPMETKPAEPAPAEAGK